jgi:hypothetical protein
MTLNGAHNLDSLAVESPSAARGIFAYVKSHKMTQEAGNLHHSPTSFHEDLRNLDRVSPPGPPLTDVNGRSHYASAFLGVTSYQDSLGESHRLNPPLQARFLHLSGYFLTASIDLGTFQAGAG